MRILGRSEREILPTVVTVFATGNNIAVAGDMTRRVMTFRLDAREERPDERVFDFDCHEEARTGRAGFIQDLLTIILAYVHAGRPIKLKLLGASKMGAS